MTTATLKKEIHELRVRQSILEESFRSLVRDAFGEDEEELRPEFIRKIERIRKRMKAGRGVIRIRSKPELREFFRSL